MNNRKNKKSIGSIIRVLLITGVGGIIGFVAGYGGVSMMKAFININSDNFLLWYGMLIASIFISFFLHIIIHESGHLIFGKISGYTFVSFRIFNIMFIKKDGKLVRKKFNIVGTGGQCLMMPPEPVDGRYPYILYNLGGSLLNFVFSGISFALVLLLSYTFSIFALIFIPFTIVGIFTGLSNIIPLKISGIANDGYNALTLGKNTIARHVLRLTLQINALTSVGTRYRDMPAEWFDLPDQTDLNDSIAVSSAILRFNYLFDRQEFDKAKELAWHLLNTADKMLEVHKNELRCELLFIEIIGGCRKEEIDRFFTRQLNKYIKATSSYVSRQRLLYAYAKLVTLDDAEAKKVLKQFEKVCTSFPNLGEIAGERDMIIVIDNAAKKNNSLCRCGQSE